MDHLLELLRRIGGVEAAAILAIFPMLEASALVGIVLPGETALILGGVLVDLGRVSFATMLLLGFIGAVLGDSIGYWVGRRWGDRILDTRPARWIGESRWARARRHMQRSGFSAVALGRFPAGVRSLVPMLAGTARMPYGRFLAANALGGALWTAASIAVGWAAGSAWQHVHGIALVIAAGLAVLVLIAIWVRVRRS